MNHKELVNLKDLSEQELFELAESQSARIAELERDAHASYMILPIVPGEALAWAGILYPHAVQVAAHVVTLGERIAEFERLLAQKGGGE